MAGFENRPAQMAAHRASELAAGTGLPEIHRACINGHIFSISKAMNRLGRRFQPLQ